MLFNVAFGGIFLVDDDVVDDDDCGVDDVGGADCGVLDIGSADFAEYRRVEGKWIHVCGK